MAERHRVTIFHTGHDHTRHPEEDDVGSRDKVGSGIVVIDILVVGLVDTVEKADGP